MGKRRGNLALGGLILALLGYVIGILTAPKSGRETRQDLQRAAIRAKRDMEKKLKSAHGELSTLIEQGLKYVDQAKARAKGEFKKSLDSAREARDNVKIALSSLREGEAGDADLQAALDEARKASEHLSAYIQKYADKTKKNK